MQDEIRGIRSDIEVLKYRTDKALKKLEKIEPEHARMFNLMYEGDQIEGRTVVDDLQLIRLVYNRVKSGKLLIGVIIGLAAVIIPVVAGFVKIITLVREWF